MQTIQKEGKKFLSILLCIATELRCPFCYKKKTTIALSEINQNGSVTLLHMTLLKSDGAKEEDDEVHSCFKTIANDSAS
jgi:hypothetical protein